MKKFLIFTAIIAITICALAFPERRGSCLEARAKSAYLMDYDSGTVVYALNEKKRLPIASMTKMMLLNLVFEKVEEGELSLDEKVTVSKTASGMGGSQVFLQADKEYSASDLVKSVIVASANDASVALAERLYGSETSCVEVMNKKAAEWGLDDTLFSNCTGLTKPTQYSCARDVAYMLRRLSSHEKYFEYSKIWLDELTHPDGQKTTLTNTNKLSRFYNGCDGGKTGYTSEAGFCLAATAKRGTMRVIGVCIGAEDSKKRFADVSEMFDYAFDNYEQKTILDKDDQPQESVQVFGGKQNCVFARPSCDVNAFMKKGEKKDYTVKYELFDKVSAPVISGDVVGSVTVYENGVEYKKVDLVAAENVEKQTFTDVVTKFGKEW